jgi:hypothetical protein
MTGAQEHDALPFDPDPRLVERIQRALALRRWNEKVKQSRGDLQRRARERDEVTNEAR